MTADSPAGTRYFSPALLLVLRLIRIAIGTEIAPRPFVPAAAGFDWDLFEKEVTRHRIGAFLLHRLPAPVLITFPRDTLGRLQEAAAVTKQRAEARAEALRQLCRELEEEQIHVVSVKGPVLAQVLYENATIRHAGDLDLLIDPADVDRLESFMRRTGRRRSTPHNELSPAQERLYREIRREYGYVNDATGVRIEVMWRLGGARLAADSLGEDYRFADLDGQRIRLLGAETEALYLFDHGTRHGWFRLFWLIDVALLVRQGGINWDRLVQRAREIGVQRALWQGVVLAHELLGSPLPGAFHGSPPTAVPRLVFDGYRHIGRPEVESTKDQPLWRAFYNLRRHDRWITWLDDVRSMALFPLIASDAPPLADRPWLFLLLRPWLWASGRLRRLLKGPPRAVER
ncbi:MAG: nucleotidyltransferase family protein [Vicinamibacterales bacterium]